MSATRHFHPIAHAIRNPVELMGAIASLTTGGVMERHPKLRAAFLEGTAGWLPWWLWRLDDQWEKFGPGCERPLSMLPSEYFKRQCYIALDVDEEPAVHAVNDMGAEYFVVSSDYPHSDGAFPEAIQQFLSLNLSGDARRKILSSIALGFTQFRPPVAALSREHKTVSAAGIGLSPGPFPSHPVSGGGHTPATACSGSGVRRDHRRRSSARAGRNARATSPVYSVRNSPRR